VTLDTLTVTHPTIQQAIDAARAWARRKNDGYRDASLVLCGPVGTGKTHIARAILWAAYVCLEDGEVVAPAGQFYIANDLIANLDSEARLPDVIRGDSHVLVIDDVGSEGTIQFVAATRQADEIQARYFRVIDFCYQRQISLVITSNLTIGGLEDHLGRRSWSRLQEMAPTGFILEMGGVPDYRRIRSGRS
jgi:DNA replication protein DnaC